MIRMGPVVTVLVVEDESLVRMDIAIGLEDAGYRVCEAADAHAALKLIAEEAVGVLFTDVDMPPGMNGLKLASLMRDRFPVMPIIIASGHKEVVADQMPTGSEFLTKPYSIDQVVAAILRLSH